MAARSGVIGYSAWLMCRPDWYGACVGHVSRSCGPEPISAAHLLNEAMRAFNVGSLCVAVAVALPLLCSTAVRADYAPSRPWLNKADPVEPRPLVPLPRLATSEAQSYEAKAERWQLPCDMKCTLLGVLSNPGDLGLSIPRQDGTAAVTFSVRPTNITRGRGLVATGHF
jgi:hypothetical protein